MSEQRPPSESAGADRRVVFRPVILCVDDELPVLRAIERLLRGEPYTLLMTKDPKEALEWLELHEVSLVIADYKMPEMTGADFLDVIRERYPKTRRILFTGYPGQTTILRGLGKGYYELWGKPWDDEKFKQSIRNILQTREPEEAIEEEAP